ncbi:hypothetical protein [Zooshikella sp. RANM57]|uniref:hypothetical protein n=1 Tax=Zooshikella sp. RANM57 TaxID=3425863 RepID=UPI003D6E3076
MMKSVNLKRIQKYIGIAVISALPLTGFAQADTENFRPGHHGGGFISPMMVFKLAESQDIDKILNDLELTPEQITNIKTLVTEAKAEKDKAFAEAGVTEEQLMQLMQNVHKSAKPSMDALKEELTISKFEKLRKLLHPGRPGKPGDPDRPGKPGGPTIPDEPSPPTPDDVIIQ